MLKFLFPPITDWDSLCKNFNRHRATFSLHAPVSVSVDWQRAGAAAAAALERRQLHPSDVVKGWSFYPRRSQSLRFPHNSAHNLISQSTAPSTQCVCEQLNSQTVLSVKYLKEHSTYLGISKKIVEFSLEPLNHFLIDFKDSVWSSEISSLLWFILIVRSHIFEGSAACDLGLAANCRASFWKQ